MIGVASMMPTPAGTAGELVHGLSRRRRIDSFLSNVSVAPRFTVIGGGAPAAHVSAADKRLGTTDPAEPDIGIRDHPNFSGDREASSCWLDAPSAIGAG